MNISLLIAVNVTCNCIRFFIGIVVVLALRRRFLYFSFLPPPGVVGMVICPSDEVDSGTTDWNLKQATAALFFCSTVMAIQTAVVNRCFDQSGISTKLPKPHKARSASRY